MKFNNDLNPKHLRNLKIWNEYFTCTYSFEHSLNDDKIFFFLETKWLVSSKLNKTVAYIP